MKNSRKTVIVGAKPLATGAQASMLDFAAGKGMVIGAEGIPPLVVNPPAALLHPGDYRAQKTYAPGTGERQRLRILRQQARAAEKVVAPTLPKKGA